MSEERGFQGVWINAGLWTSSDLSWMEKCLLAEIDNLSDETKGPCFASCEALAERMSVESGTMRNVLSELTKSGYLVTFGFDGRRCWRSVAPQYSSNPCKFRAWATSSSCHEIVRAGAGKALQQVQVIHDSSCMVKHDTEIPVEIPTEIPIPPNPLKGGSVRSSDCFSNNQKNSHSNGVFSEEQKKKKKLKLSVDLVLGTVPSDLTLQSPSFLKAWREWIENRLQLRNPTLGSFTKHMEVCKRLGEARAISAISHSIASGYLTIYERRSAFLEKQENRDKVGSSL